MERQQVLVSRHQTGYPCGERALEEFIIRWVPTYTDRVLRLDKACVQVEKEQDALDIRLGEFKYRPFQDDEQLIQERGG